MQKIDPFDMLYRAKWNVPQAAAAMGLPNNSESWELVKQQFREWAVNRPLPDPPNVLYYKGG
jgi:hypothetical protein